MLYSPDYLSFYSGENRKSIFKIFANFIDCLRRNDMHSLKDLLADDCIADISMTGHYQGADEVCKGLQWPGPVMDLQRITFSNFVCRSHLDTAQQSAYSQHLYALEDHTHAFPFTFGGEWINTYQKKNGKWKLSHIRFDLMFEDGNNSIVKDFWQLMDYSVFYGHTPIINPEIESPWIAIPYDDEPQSDAEQIFELEFKNNTGMDGGFFSLSHEVFTDDVFLNYAHHQNINKNYSGLADGDYHGRKAAINFFKGKQHKEARLQHNVSMAHLIIQNDQARAYMLRSEYHRIKHNIYDKTKIHMQPLSAVHEIDAKKENGVWKMMRMAYYPIMEFYPLPVECVCFDEYICGGNHWKRIKESIGIHV